MKIILKERNFMLAFVSIFIAVTVASIFLRCGNVTILESTHEKNIKGDWIKDSLKVQMDSVTIVKEKSNGRY